jgi:hypothetical protein
MVPAGFHRSSSMNRTLAASLAALAAFGWVSAGPAFAQGAVTTGNDGRHQAVIFEPLPQAPNYGPAAPVPSWLLRAEGAGSMQAVTNNAGHNGSAVIFGALPQAAPDFLTAAPSPALQRFNSIMQGIEGAQNPG